ncbi:MAG: very short patch repair endonuclease [Deltaproteobacteria bacterium]|nr:very short patch repair endonuclease [Deltaproteobacteria bacterium]
MLLRRACHALGLRYRLSVKGLPGKPDLVFLGACVAVFVDGDFWHGRDLDARIARLSTGHNAAYWVAKVTSNVARDRRQDAALRELGWRVVRVWESEVRTDPVGAAKRVAEVARARRSL